MKLFGEIDWSMIGDMGCAGGRWVINGKPVQVVTDGYNIIWGGTDLLSFFCARPRFGLFFARDSVVGQPRSVGTSVCERGVASMCAQEATDSIQG